MGDIDDAIAKFSEAEARLAEAQKNQAQAQEGIAEIEASIEKDKASFAKTVEFTTKNTLERQAAATETTIKELEAGAANRIEAYIASEAITRGVTELRNLNKKQKEQFMDAAIAAL